MAVAAVAGRLVPRVYDVAGRADIHALLLDAVTASQGTVLYDSGPAKVPVFVGLVDPVGRRRGLLIYPFRMTRRTTRNRPADEVRGQIRYGAEASWLAEDHFIGRDMAGVDTTLLLGVYPEAGLFVGLDPALYDPLPLGISVYAKESRIAAVTDQGWAVWEGVNRPGKRRLAPRSSEGLETIVGFRPDKLLQYAEFERRASDLGLDPPLRYAAAVDAGRAGRGASNQTVPSHILEQNFDLAAYAILDIIGSRMRLEVAVKGGVAEYHLEQLLRADTAVSEVHRLDADAQPDFEVRMADGRTALVECKNVSPEPYANGNFKVEVQKTRATRDDPAGRLYRPEQFDVVAACLYSPTRRWEFRYKRTSLLGRHPAYADRLAATHRVDATWAVSLVEALDDRPVS